MPRRLLSALALLATTAFLGTSTAEEPEAAAVLGRTEGGAAHRGHKNLPWRPLRTGAEIRLGGELRCDRPCEIVLPDRSRVLLDAGAVASVAEPTFVRTTKGARAERAHRVDLHRGALWAERPAGERSLALGTRGEPVVSVAAGRVRMIATDARTSVAFFTGHGHIRGKTAWAAVSEGHAATVDRSGTASVRPIVGTPAWTKVAPTDADAALAFGFGGGDVPVRGRWAKVAGASAYRVVVAKDPTFASVVEDATVREPAFHSRPLPAGGYWMRVVAVDPEGIASPASAVRRVRVVPVELPAGAFRAEGRVVVPPGSGIRLLDSKDLDVAIDRGGFSRASAQIPGVEASPRLVRLRLRDDPSSETGLTLAPSALRAEVTMSPRLPRWPSDPIDIVVDISDSSGLQDPATVAANVRVRIGLDETPVRWTSESVRGHRVLRTRLAPKPVYGPTVVRVDVSDGAGVPLGRAFVEVAREAAPQTSSAPASRAPARTARR